VSRSVGDADEAVMENRRRLAARLAVEPPERWAWLRQVHGAEVADADGLPGPDPVPADAAVTSTPGRVLVVQTADCAPLALASGRAIAVVHAGWPGLVAGVIEHAVAALRARGDDRVLAALGPCVHPADYEFGRADLDTVIDRLGPSVEGRTRHGRPALDVPAAVRAALGRAGVEEMEDVAVCTFASPDHFSYRRDGVTGRQALVVTMEG
jgi:polyphenol oxidase